MVIATAQLHSTKPELRFCAGSNPAPGVLKIHNGEDLWQWSRLEIRFNAFRRSTIPQNISKMFERILTHLYDGALLYHQNFDFLSDIIFNLKWFCGNKQIIKIGHPVLGGQSTVIQGAPRLNSFWAFASVCKVFGNSNNKWSTTVTFACVNLFKWKLLFALFLIS